MRGKMRRPSGDCAMARRAISCVGVSVMSRPANSMRPSRALGHHQRRLAGAVGADQRDDLAFVDDEIDALERGDGAVPGADAGKGEEGFHGRASFSRAREKVSCAA